MDQISWSHPTNKAPKTISLLCLGNSRLHYEAACLQSDLSPVLADTDEVWTLNRGGMFYQHDLLWIMDHIQGEADKYPAYGAALWKHDKPIITSDNCEGWPDHVYQFPFDHVWNWLRQHVNPMHGDWYHNSLAYILTYAAFIGVKEIRVFGADYHNHSSGMVEDGHPNVAYWVGKLECTGMVVKPVENSFFLNANQRDYIYGYQLDPRKIKAVRSRFRDLIGAPSTDEDNALLSGERQVAPSIDSIQPDHVARYEWAKRKASGTVIDVGCGIAYGAKILSGNPSIETVFAVDRSAEALAFGKERFFDPKIIYRQADLDHQFLLQADQCDYAVAFELIEHLVDPKPLLKSIPAKRLLASVPNESVVPYSPEAAPFHHRHYTLQEFALLLESCGWSPQLWFGQLGPESPVGVLTDRSRTLIVEAERCHPLDT